MKKGRLLISHSAIQFGWFVTFALFGPSKALLVNIHLASFENSVSTVSFVTLDREQRVEISPLSELTVTKLTLVASRQYSKLLQCVLHKLAQTKCKHEVVCLYSFSFMYIIERRKKLKTPTWGLGENLLT